MLATVVMEHDGDAPAVDSQLVQAGGDARGEGMRAHQSSGAALNGRYVSCKRINSGQAVCLKDGGHLQLCRTDNRGNDVDWGGDRWQIQDMHRHCIAYCTAGLPTVPEGQQQSPSLENPKQGWTLLAKEANKFP